MKHLILATIMILLIVGCSRSTAIEGGRYGQFVTYLDDSSSIEVLRLDYGSESLLHERALHEAGTQHLWSYYGNRSGYIAVKQAIAQRPEVLLVADYIEQENP